jgi:hypothetical protein
MALSLIAYFCAMISALAVFVTLLSGVLPPHRFPEPHPIVVAEPAKNSANNAASKMPIRCQAVADAMTPNKEAGAASLKPRDAKVTRYRRPHRDRSPQQQPNSGLTALALQDNDLRVIDNPKDAQQRNLSAVSDKPIGYRMSRRNANSIVTQ